MYYGFTESESFQNQTLLNRYRHHKVVVEQRADGKGYWNIFILNIEDKDIKKVIGLISRSLKPDWNAIFFNADIVYALFKDKVFKLKRKKIWRLPDYEEVKKYAKDCDVGDLDMNEVFRHYKKLLAVA